MEKTILEPVQKITVADETDVVVVGGGPAGISAAVSAARNGAKVTLIERYGHLGGMATGGLVILIPHLSHGSKTQELMGMNQEWIDRLEKYDAILHPSRDEIGSKDPLILQKWQQYFSVVVEGDIRQTVYYDPEILKIILNEMAEEAKIKVMLHCWGCRALVEDGSVTGVVYESKEGRKAVLGRLVIDTTGDGDIFSSAGADFEVDADKSSRNAMMAVVYRIGNVDFEEYGKQLMTENQEERARIGAELSRIAGFKSQTFPTNRKDTVWVNNWIPGKDCLKVEDLTEVEFMVRRNLLQVLEYLKKEVPGFNKSYIYDTASQIGTRGSRRVVGEYKVTMEDLKQGKRHEDVIAILPGMSKRLIPEVVHIPYRALVPIKIDNLLVAGRCYSSDVAGNNFSNLIPHCIAMGEAAGAAAAISLNSNVKPRAVDTKSLQKTLKDQGVYLG